jgi:hypothetical protein
MRDNTLITVGDLNRRRKEGEILMEENIKGSGSKKVRFF